MIMESKMIIKLKNKTKGTFMNSTNSFAFIFWIKKFLYYLLIVVFTIILCIMMDD